MKEFRASATFLVFLYALLAFLTLGGLGVFVLGITGTPVGWEVWFILPGLVIMAWLWWVYLRIPFIISFQDDHTLEFKSLVQEVILSPQDIVAIREGCLIPGFLQVTHSTGKLMLTTQMTDMPGLIALIKEENPGVDISAC
ncbi:MAG: hypothetical protein P8X49_13895 [Syntrophobacterales bacterium]|jgi:hypothetical protein